MWVYFDMDEPTALQVRELVRQGKFGPASEGRLRRSRSISSLANEKGFPHEAILDFVNNQLDQATATLLIRAIFREPQAGQRPAGLHPEQFRARPRADERPVPGTAGEPGGRGDGSGPEVPLRR